MDEIVLCYSGKSRITAEKIAEASGGRITAVRQSFGDVNWGRSVTNLTERNMLNADTSNSTNKRGMRILFGDNDVPMPQLRVPDSGNTNEILGIMWAVRHGEALVGRPDHHMKGRGYWLCRTVEDVRKALRGTRRKAAATHFMEFIPHATEYRVHIFNGKSIRISEKDFTNMRVSRVYATRTGDMKAELSFMARKPTCDKETLKKVRRAAKKAVAALDLDFGAVDVLVNDNGVYVLEVNSSPGLGGSLPALYSQKIIEWFDNREEE